MESEQYEEEKETNTKKKEEDNKKKEEEAHDAKFILQKELREMIIAFGDFEEVSKETVQKLEIYLIDFLGSVLKEAYRRSKRAGYNKIRIKDLLKVVEYDERLFLRIPALYRSIAITKDIRATFHS